MSESQYNWLYTIYSLPNIVLPFFGGYLCDKVRVRVRAVIETPPPAVNSLRMR